MARQRRGADGDGGLGPEVTRRKTALLTGDGQNKSDVAPTLMLDCLGVLVDAAKQASKSAPIDEGTSNTAEPAAVMAKMRELQVQDFMIPGGGTVSADGQVIRPIQLLQVKARAESKGLWDLARMVFSIPRDEAFRPLSERACLLVEH